MSDLIDRQAAIDAVSRGCYELRGVFAECEKNLNELPSVQPEQREAAKRLNDLIFDINPAEICSQIESDHLKRWCEIIQTEMKMAMFQLPCWNEKEEV